MRSVPPLGLTDASAKPAGSERAPADLSTPLAPDAAPRPPRVIRSAVLSAYTQAARLVGLDPDAMMRSAGIPKAAIDDPDLRLASDSVQALLTDSALQSGRDDFGLLMGDLCKLSILGPLGLLMRAQPTVGAAFRAYARYVGYLNDTVSVRLKESGSDLFVIPVIAGPSPAAPRESTDAVMGQLLQALRALAPAGGRPSVTCFAYPAPLDPSPYSQRFGQVEFNREFSGLLISATDLARPLSTADADVARTLVRLIESRGSLLEESMADRVAMLVERLLPRGDCSARRVAQMLGVDRRTIHRRLAMDGVTFTALVDRTRRKLAPRLLRSGGRSITEVADLLGFSSLNSFSRWFQRSYGASAREYRKYPPTPE